MKPALPEPGQIPVFPKQLMYLSCCAGDSHKLVRLVRQLSRAIVVNDIKPNFVIISHRFLFNPLLFPASHLIEALVTMPV